MIDFLGDIFFWLAYALAHGIVGNFWCCCEESIPACSSCLGGSPDELELVIAGVAIGTCLDSSHPASCLDYNATHILPRISACIWKKTGFLNCPPVDDFLQANLVTSPKRAIMALAYASDIYAPGGTLWNCASGAVIVPAGTTPASPGSGGCDCTSITYGLTVV